MKKTTLASEDGVFGDLFPPWIPPWIEGETLYSLCSRYHRIAGGRRASTTCQRLFGHPRVGLSHDVPGRVGWLIERSGGTVGLPEDLVLGRTVLGYYLCSYPIAEQRKVIEAVLSDGPRGLKARLGWLATRLGASHPLRACDQCVLEDLEHHQIPTWRLFHQLPAVWVCARHGVHLWTTGWKSDGSHRFQWVLPDDIPAHARHVPALDWRDDVLALASDVATAAASIAVQYLGEPLAVKDLAKILRVGLIRKGLATPSGRLKSQSIGSGFSAFLSRFAGWPEAPALCIGSDAAMSSLRRAMQASGRPVHPLRYVVAANWIFGSWATFDAACRSRDVHDQRSVVDMSTARRGDEPSSRVRAAFLQRLEEGTGAVTSVAKALGIDAQTGLLWAEQAGHTIQRRPKLLDEKTRACIVRDLAVGRPKITVAERYRVSVVTVTRVLLSTLGLKESRDRRLHNCREAQVRREIEQCLKRFPRIGAKELRERCPSAFAWLYRHDRSWIQRLTKGLHRARQPPAHRVKWGARDQEFAAALQHFQQTQNVSPVALDRSRPSDLIRAIPGLKQKARHLSRMPCTAKAIAEITVAASRKR